MSQLLTKIFAEMNNSRINYVVLRNYEEMPEVLSDGDVDILVSREDSSHLEDLLQNFGFLIVSDLFPHRFALFFDEAESEFIKFDIVDRLAFGKKMIMPLPSSFEQQILKNSITYKDFFVPAPDDEFFLLFLHCVGDRKHFKPAYQDRLKKLVADGSEQTNLVQSLDLLFGGSAGEMILSLVRQENFIELCSLHTKLRAFLLRNLTFTHVLQTVKIFGQRISRRIFGRKGLRIALMGPDGSGKSTLANIIQAKDFLNTSFVYMGRDQFVIPTRRIIKKIRRLLGKDKSKGDDHSAPSQIETLIPVQGGYRDILDVFRFFHDLVDFYCRYFFYNFLKYRNGLLVINDRYLYDMLSGGEKIQKMGFIKWMILNFFPRPDYVFLLDAPASKMYARKGEHSVEVLDAMKVNFANLQEQLHNCYYISTDRSPQESAAEILAHIWRDYFLNLAKR